MTTPYRFFCGSYPNSYLTKLHEQKTYKTYNKKRKLQIVEFIPIATDGNSILQGGEDIPIEVFFETNESKSYLVATLREYEFLLPFICQNKIKLAVIERDFPIFEDIKYTANLKRNYQQIREKYRVLKTYNIRGKSLTLSIVPHLRSKFFKAVTSRCNLDGFFGLADNRPYSECFAVQEEREDRCIIALDVNSMFLHCMERPFGDPSSLRRVTNLAEVDFTDPPIGLFRVILKKPITDFIKQYHPFKFTNDLEEYPFEFDELCEVEVLLSSDEYNFYINHFESVEVLECFVFDKKVVHPLLRLGMKLFKKKQLTPRGPRRSLLKSQLVYLHSISNSKEFTYEKFRTIVDLLEKVSLVFNLKKKPKTNRELTKLFSSSKGKLRITQTKNGYQLAYRNIQSPETVNSFGFEVISRSRVYMLKLLQKLSSFPNLQICYANVDSVHISIEKKDKEEFFQVFKDDLCEKSLGKLKIEAIAKSGYWLGLGHYYLASGLELNKFKTGMIKSPGNDKPIQYRRMLNKVKEEKHLKFLSQTTLHVGNTFSYKKETSFDKDFVGYQRLRISSLRDDIIREMFLCKEISRSKPFKLDLLDRLNGRFCSE